MIDEKKKHEVLMLKLSRFVSKHSVAKVADWVLKQPDPIQDYGSETLLQAIRDYEAASRKQVYWPDNDQKVYDYLVKERFGFASEQALDEVDDRLSTLLWDTTTELRTWRGGRLCMTEFDDKYTVARAGNMIYKLLEPKLTDKQKSYQKQAFKSDYQIWNPDDLKAAAIQFLKENRTGEWTQDQIASALKASSKFLYHLLKDIVADSALGVVTYKVARESGDKRSNRRQVYKYSPTRIKLLLAKDRDSYIERLIAYLLEKKPEVSRLQVYKILHTYLGQIDNKAVYRVLDKMIAEGTVLCEQSAYNNAKLCKLADANSQVVV